jgi:hypothetical protein
MIQRCTNPNLKKFAIYGGRGIRVCDQWASFANFLADMGEPSPGMTLDRINPNGNYEPENCRWATQREQQNNRTNNRCIEWQGQNLTAHEWARRTGINYKTIQRRLERGWSTGEALTLPASYMRRDRRPS